MKYSALVSATVVVHRTFPVVSSFTHSCASTRKAHVSVSGMSFVSSGLGPTPPNTMISGPVAGLTCSTAECPRRLDGTARVFGITSSQTWVRVSNRNTSPNLSQGSVQVSVLARAQRVCLAKAGHVHSATALHLVN